MADLTDKQRLFVEHYLACLNGAEAARRAGFADGPGIYQEAYRLLRNAEIRAAIDAAMADVAMPRSEVLGRLTAQARADIGELFVPSGRGVRLDLKRVKALGMTHCIKRYSRSAEGTVTVELYDAQAALALLGKYYKLFVDRQELTGRDGAPIEMADARVRLLDRLARRAADADTLGDSDAAGGSG